jgi:hypothetical protein
VSERVLRQECLELTESLRAADEAELTEEALLLRQKLAENQKLQGEPGPAHGGAERRLACGARERAGVRALEV